MIPADESIESTVAKLGDAGDNVYFVLSYYEVTMAVIVYKLPGDLSLLRYAEMRALEKEERLHDEVRSERQELERILKEIDGDNG